MATHLCSEQHVKDDCFGEGSCKTQAEHPGGSLQRGWSFSKPAYANPEGLAFQMVRTAALRDDGPHGGPEQMALPFSYGERAQHMSRGV